MRPIEEGEGIPRLEIRKKGGSRPPHRLSGQEKEGCYADIRF